MRFNLRHGMWTTGTNSPFELIEGSKKYTVKGIAQKIKCPTLVLEAEKDDSFPGQPKKVMIHSPVQKDTFYSLLKRVQRNIVNAVLLLFQISVFLIGWTKYY